MELEKDLDMSCFTAFLQCFVVFMEHDNTLNDFSTWNVVRGLN